MLIIMTFITFAYYSSSDVKTPYDISVAVIDVPIRAYVDAHV